MSLTRAEDSIAWLSQPPSSNSWPSQEALQEQCPSHIEISTDRRDLLHEVPNSQCGCMLGGSPGVKEDYSVHTHSHVVLRRTVARLQASIATIVIVVFTLISSVLLFVGVCKKSKSVKRTMRPALGVAKQWVGDLSDVFVIFPWKGARFLLEFSIVVPLRALAGAGFAIHSARKLRLQRQLLEEDDSQGGDHRDRPKPKQAKHDRGNTGASGGSTPSAKAKRKVTLPEKERKKEPEPRSTSSVAAAGGTSPASLGPGQSSHQSAAAAALSTGATPASPSQRHSAQESGAARRLATEEPTTAEAPLSTRRVKAEDTVQHAQEPLQSPSSDSREAEDGPTEWRSVQRENHGRRWGRSERKKSGEDEGIVADTADTWQDSASSAPSPPRPAQAARSAVSATQVAAGGSSPQTTTFTTDEELSLMGADQQALEKLRELGPHDRAAVVADFKCRLGEIHSPSKWLFSHARSRAAHRQLEKDKTTAGKGQGACEHRADPELLLPCAADQQASASCLSGPSRQAAAAGGWASPAGASRKGHTATATLPASPTSTGASVPSGPTTRAVPASSAAEEEAGSSRGILPIITTTDEELEALGADQQALEKLRDLEPHDRAAIIADFQAKLGEIHSPSKWLFSHARKKYEEEKAAEASAAKDAAGARIAAEKGKAKAEAHLNPPPGLAAIPVVAGDAEGAANATRVGDGKRSRARGSGGTGGNPASAATPVGGAVSPKGSAGGTPGPTASAPLVEAAKATDGTGTVSRRSKGDAASRKQLQEQPQQQQQNQQGRPFGPPPAGPAPPPPPTGAESRVAASSNTAEVAPASPQAETSAPVPHARIALWPRTPAPEVPPPLPTDSEEPVAAKAVAATAQLAEAPPSTEPPAPPASPLGPEVARLAASPASPMSPVLERASTPPLPELAAAPGRARARAGGTAGVVGLGARAAKALQDNTGCVTGGTGGTVDFGWNSEFLIRQLMEQQEEEAAVEDERANFLGESIGGEAAGVSDTTPLYLRAMEAGQLAEMKAPDRPSVPPPGMPEIGAQEDDVGERLEAMVEELAGSSGGSLFFHSQQGQGSEMLAPGSAIDSFGLLEDAFSKVDAAREALSRVVQGESWLSDSAPAFVPGQLWTGHQRSSFVD